MKPIFKRRLWRVAAVLFSIIAALEVCFLGLLYYTSPELMGLIPVGTASFRKPEPEPDRALGEWLDFFIRHKEAWAQSAGASSREVYRFVYEPSFDHYVCVSAWQDGERYWIRSSVLIEYLPTNSRFSLWERTRALPAERWKEIRAMFAKRSVIDPLDGKERESGWDGSYWTLESVVDGRTTRSKIWSPGETHGQRGNFTITPYPRFEDFVEAGKRMLEYGRVTVRDMY